MCPITEGKEKHFEFELILTFYASEYAPPQSTNPPAARCSIDNPNPAAAPRAAKTTHPCNRFSTADFEFPTRSFDPCPVFSLKPSKLLETPSAQQHELQLTASQAMHHSQQQRRNITSASQAERPQRPSFEPTPKASSKRGRNPAHSTNSLIRAKPSNSCSASR